MSNKRRKEMFKESKSVKQRYATRKLKVGMVSLLMGFTFIFASAPAAKVIGIPMTVSAEEEEEKTGAEKFKEDNASILLKDENTVEKSDVKAIEKALSDYNGLSEEEQGKLNIEKSKLDAMKKKLEAPEKTGAEKFKEDNASILLKDENTVEKSDVKAIEKALSDYNGLSEEEQGKLNIEKSKLDAMKKKLEAPEKTGAEKFKEDNASILLKDENTVEKSDVKAIEKALSDYNGLSEEEQGKLNIEKSKLDAMKKKLEAPEKTGAEKFKEDNASILLKDENTVEKSDVKAIEKALSDYNGLSEEEQGKLKIEKSKLDAMKKKLETPEKTGAEKFKEDNASILLKDENTVEKSDVKAIEKALSDYNGLSEEEQGKLKIEKSKLDAMKKKLETPEKTGAEKFKEDNASILLKDENTVEKSDVKAIEKALSDYDDLSEEEQGKLKIEKSKLDAMKKKLETPEKTGAEKFKEDNASILLKDENTVEKSDVEAIEKALSDYDDLSEEEQGKLKIEKSKLDAMKKKLETPEKTGAEKFKEDNASILLKDENTVEKSDVEAIEKALSDYDDLSEEEQGKLKIEKSKLDAMKKKLETPEKTGAEKFKEDNASILLKDENTVEKSDVEAIEKALSDYDDLSEEEQGKLKIEKSKLDAMKKKLETPEKTGAEKFKEDNASILLKDENTVEKSDVEAIEKALSDYDDLSEEEQGKLKIEKSKLDAMKKKLETPEKTGAEKFKEDNASILLKDENTVEKSDVEAIEKALSDYDDLSEEEQGKLKIEKSKLDAMKKKLETPEKTGAEKFKEDNASILLKDENTVEKSDVEAIEKALSDYDDLSEEEQGKLKIEKSKLDAMKKKLETPEKTGAEKFKEDNASILLKDENTVEKSDVEAIEKALSDYDDLSEEEQGKLKIEKSKLDAMKKKLETPEKTGAEKFKEDNASILLKDENTVEKSDVEAIEKALSDYDDLSEEEQGKLKIEKSKLDAMKKKLETPEKTGAEKFKEDNASILLKDENTVEKSDVEAIEKALSDYDDLSEEEQGKLKIEKSKLDAMKKKLETPEKTGAEKFKEDNASILLKDENTVEKSDVEAIEKALSDYDDLSEEEQGKLKIEKSKLDAMKKKLETPEKTGAEKFKEDNASILLKDENTVEKSDVEAIEKALSDYDDLSEEEQGKLKIEKSKLDAMKKKLETPEKTGAEKFKEDNASILLKDENTVEKSDVEAIEKALSDYDDLSEEEQGKLKIEKSKLDAMKKKLETPEKTGAEKFKEDNASILLKDENTVEKSDVEAIEKALSDYDDLSEEEQGKLKIEKSKLDAMKKKLETPEKTGAEKFKEDNASILLKDENTVEKSDVEAIEKALSDYDDLSEEEQGKLKIEKSKLDAMKKKLETPEKTGAEKFKEDNASILLKDENTVEKSDVEAIEKALSDYDDLSEEEQGKLKIEKSKLDAMKKKLETPEKTGAEKFKEDNASILLKDENTVEKSDVEAIEKALSDYDDLSEEEQGKLKIEKSKLDAMKKKLETPEKTGAEKFKEDNASILLKDENTVEKSDVEAIEKALSDYDDLSEEEQGKLKIEKSKLDAMKKKLETPEKTGAEKFKEDNASILLKDENTVEKSDVEAIEKALSDYDDLSEEEQGKLKIEKSKLDAMKKKLETPEKTGAEKFKEDNASILLKDENTVEKSDVEAIEKALSDYDDLSEEEQGKLKIEKSKLDAMKKKLETPEKTGAEKFKEDNASILLKDENTVEKSDVEAIEKALSDYDDLSEEEQGKLKIEKSKLDAMKKKLETPEKTGAEKFKEDNASILLKDENTVEKSDVEAIEKALSDYDDLSEEEQGKLKIEKSKLDAMKKKLETPEKTGAEKFKEDNASILLKDENTVEKSDVEAIEKALSDYDDLSEEEQGKLKIEKSKLDAMKKKLETPEKTGAEKFKEDNASILLKDENTVEKSDVEAIEKALSDYNDLSEEEQGKLKIEKSKLDAMKKKLEAPETKPSYSGGGGGGGSYTPASKVTSDRIAGSNRFDTAVKVSQSAYPDGAKTVILANGEKFSDVLAAMPYGKTIKAPILYTNFDNIPDETLKELKRLGVEKVILVGGEKSISLDEQKTLEGKGYKIDRINGVDRYETSKLIAERMKAAGAKGINDVIIASGQVFPDALSISPLAVENEIPILLTSKDTLSEYTIKSLDNVKDGKIYITGGVNSVSNSVESKLKEYTKQKITRFAGADRYETSQIIAKSLRPNATTSVFASGELFSDALVAGELVSKDNAPLMLVKKNNLPSSISNYVKDSKITNNVIVGGVNTVSDSVVSKIEELENR